MSLTYLSCSTQHEHEHSSMKSASCPGNRCEPSAERHALNAEQHDHSSTHQTVSTRARARRREHSRTSTSTRWPGNLTCVKPACRAFLYSCGFTCAWMALCARNAPPWLLASFRDFGPPEHLPRTSARAHTCTAVFTRASCVPRNREHEKRSAGGRAKNADVQEKSIWYIVLKASGLLQQYVHT